MVSATVRWGITVVGGGRYSVCVTQRLLNSNDFATSAALAEVCALLSAVLVNNEVLWLTCQTKCKY